MPNYSNDSDFDLIEETKSIFSWAAHYYNNKHNENIGFDGDSFGYDLLAVEYRTGIRDIKILIRDNRFVDEEAYMLVFDSVEGFRQRIIETYPMLNVSIMQYLDKIRSIRHEYSE